LTTPETRARPLLYFLVLLAVNFMWAFQFSGAKMATEQLGPIAVAFVPVALSTLLLIPIVLVQNARRKPRVIAERRAVVVRNFILLALCGSTPAQVCLTIGLTRSLASNASVLTLTIPILTALMAVVLLGEKMTLVRWLSFAMAIAGVLLVSDVDWRSVALFHGSYLLGNALIFFSCVGSAFYNSFSKKLLDIYSPVEVLAYSFVVSDAALLMLMLLFERSSVFRLAGLGALAWLNLLVLAVFSLCMSMLLFFWVIQRIDVTRASLSIYLLPVFGVMISSIALHERIRSQLVVGGSLVFISTFLVTTYEERRKMRELQTAVAQPQPKEGS
jgi:drug/metabolite transporter (DMT)-like permease